MHIDSVTIDNYRTFDNCVISFLDTYTAISGKNNAGKSNLLRVIQSFFVNDIDDEFDPFSEQSNFIDFKSDYPIWKGASGIKNPIKFSITLRIHKNRDEGLFKFVTTFLQEECKEEEFTLVLGQEHLHNSNHVIYSLSFNSKKIDDRFKVEEIHKKIKNTNSLIFHNSITSKNSLTRGSSLSFFGSISPEDKEKIKECKNALFRRLNLVAAKHKEEIRDLLGRLEEKYEVGLSIPTFDFENFPFSLSLGNKKESVQLHALGSGTQNRTHILLALLHAKKIRESGSESNRITPILIIEEPESFLHPSAQAEFGRILLDLSSEFQVQIIVTTHSPQLLSTTRPEANILLSRRIERNHTKESFVEKTNEIDWMKPFALALGITEECFGAWKDVLFSQSQELLFTEGKIDKNYFEDLKLGKHGDKKLILEGDICEYGGEGFFAHDVILKFIISRYNRVIITYDLDVDKKIFKKLQSLGLKEGEDFFAVGIDSIGKRNIEGLLPARITSDMAIKYPDLFNAASSADEGNKDAKNKIKIKKQEHFFETAKIENGDYTDFYSLVSRINRSLRKKRKKS